MNKLLKYFTFIVVLFLIIVILLQYYVSRPTEPQRLVCHKGKLLVQVEGEGTVYVRIKRFSCDNEKGMLILEEQL